MTKQFDNFADLITFTRASTGTALRRVGYGSELVTNGTFDDGTTGFTASGATLSNVSNQLVSTSTGSGFAGRAETTVSTVAGKTYYFTVDAVSAIGGSTFAAIRVGTSLAAQDIVANTPVTIGSSYAVSFVAQGTTTHLSFVGSGTTGITNTWDNISVKEVIFDRATDPLVLFNHPTNTPRIEFDINGNRKGILIEEARTNSIRNSDAGGAVVGSPGNLPTHWAVFGGTAATEIVGIGTENGSSYVDVRITGAPSSAAILNFETPAQIAVTEGQSWTLSFKARIVAGDTTNVTFLQPSINWRDGGGFVSRITGADFKDDTSTSSRTLSGVTPAGITFVLPQIFLNCSGAVDFTLRISSPQLELGSFPTSYIPTAGAAASRSADVASIPTSAFGYNADKGTVVVDFETQFGGTTNGFPRIWEIGNTSTSINRVQVYVSASVGNVLGAVVSNNVLSCNINTGAQTSPASGRFAFAFADDDFAALIDGGSPVTDTSGSFTTPSIPRDTLKIGGAGDNSSSNISGHIKSIQYYPRRLTNAQLQRLTS